MSTLKLTVNEDKTRICRVPEGAFDFLGFSALQRQKKGDGKKSRKAAWKMREGPSRSAFRSRSQTTPSRCG